MKRAGGVRQEGIIFLLNLVQNPNADRVKEFQEFILVKKYHFFGSDQFLIDYPDGPKEPKIREFLEGVEEVILKLKDAYRGAEGDKAFIEYWRSIVHDGIRLTGSTNFKVDPIEEKFTLRTEDENLWNNKKEWGKNFISNLLLGEDIARLRLCKNCDNLFYVAHGNKKTCSVECGKKKNYKNTKEKLDKEYLTMRVRKSQFKKHIISLRRSGSTKDLDKKQRKRLYDMCSGLWKEQKRSQQNIDRLLPKI
jgi:hypothetical protein